MSFTIRSVSDTLEFFAKLPQRAPLFQNLWREGQLACALAQDSAAAADLALDIALSVAESHKVIFFGFQTSIARFVERTKGIKAPQLICVDLSLADISPSETDAFLKEMETTIVASGSKVCVVDSMFYLCEWYGKSGAARFFVARFREMSRRLGLSVLLAANARKRIGNNPPTAEHLPKGTAPYIDTVLGPQTQSDQDKSPAEKLPEQYPDGGSVSPRKETSAPGAPCAGTPSNHLKVWTLSELREKHLR